MRMPRNSRRWQSNKWKASTASRREGSRREKPGDGRAFFINEYRATKTYSQWERVAYVQLPKAVAYIVLSSRDEASYRKDAPALRHVLKTFAYLEPQTETGAH